MRVLDWMQSEVPSIPSSASLQQAALTMWTCDVGALPVLGPDGSVVGMITDRDIALAAALRRRTLDVLDVRGSMSKGLWSCAPEDQVDEAERAMCDHRVRRLPVIDAHGKLVGVISLSDVARAAQVRLGSPALPAFLPHRLRA